MSKEFEEALGLVKRTCELFIKSSSHLIGTDIIANQINEALDTIKQALTELKQIKEAKPSEALKYVNGKIADLEDDLQHYTMVEKDKCKEFYIREDLKQFTNIQQALLKVQEQEKVLKIIKEKEVNFEVFGAFETYKDYEIYYDKKFHLIENKLTKEEFELLKEVFD